MATAKGVIDLTKRIIERRKEKQRKTVAPGKYTIIIKKKELKNK